MQRDTNQPYRYRSEALRELLETVAANEADDESIELFLSARFCAGRDGDFNEDVYNFFSHFSANTWATPKPRPTARPPKQ